MEEHQSEVDSYCHDPGDVDEFAEYQCSDVEQGSQSEETDSCIVIVCPGCGYEMDVRHPSCLICGSVLTLIELGTDSQQEPQL